MKKLNFFLTLPLFASMFSVPAFATTLEKIPRTHQFTVGLEGFYYKYHEPRLMRSHGFLYGVNGAYNYTFCHGFFLQPDFRVAYGRTRYKSHDTGSMKHEPNWLVETRLVSGKWFKLAEATEIAPYLGFGYRFKKDDTTAKVTTTGHIGYLRESQYFYIPLGATLNQKIACDWSIAPTIEFDWFLYGGQRSAIRALGNKETSNHTQKRGYGLKGDLMLTKKLTRSSISVGPFINYWDIRDSNTVASRIKNKAGETVGISWSVEPHNKTIEVGLKLNYNF